MNAPSLNRTNRIEENNTRSTASREALPQRAANTHLSTRLYVIDELKSHQLLLFLGAQRLGRVNMAAEMNRLIGLLSIHW